MFEPLETKFKFRILKYQAFMYAPVYRHDINFPGCEYNQNTDQHDDRLLPHSSE